MKSALENLNIALVHDWITNVSGGERVLLALSAMFPQAPIFTTVFDAKKAKPFAGKNIRTSFLQKIPGMRNWRELLVPFAPFAFEQFDFSGFDLVISSSSMAAKGIITKPGTTHVCYCHTPSRYLWEPQVDPRGHSGRFAWLRRQTIHNMRIWDRLAADRVDYFIANSKYIAGRIRKYYRADSTVIYPPVETERFSISDKTSDYFLFVSRLIDYKRCDIVIEAFSKLGLPLKVIGRGPQRERLQKMARSNIEFLGFLSDEEVTKYYAEAKAFIFAAEEDFGIVPVEAMAAGRPVIAYGVGGAAESVADGVTGILFSEQTSDSLMEAVKRFDKFKFDPEFIKRQAERFSTERFEREMTDFLNKVLDSA